MNKKKFILFPLLAFVLSSCLFDSDDDGLSNWLSDQGMPSSYKVQTVTVGDLNPLSAEVYRDTLPKSAWRRGVFGTANGISYDAVFDFALDSAFLDTLNSADSAISYLHLRLWDSYYNDYYLPSNFFPIKEDLKLNVSWILSEKLKKSEFDKIGDAADDSVWSKELETWKAKNSADTTLSISIVKKDSLLTLDMPKALVDDLHKNKGYRRLQLRLSAPEAKHIYRFYGAGSVNYYPQLILVAKSKKDSPKSFGPKRAVNIYSNLEDCSDCLVLHGGGIDSLLVEFPSKPILKALADFYGDEFPYTVGDSNDVRQAVVMAVVTFFRDDSKGSQEMNLPILVQAGSFLDSADTSIINWEEYKKNKARVDSIGHPNVVFYPGDSLSLQVTYGMRDFINRASDGRTFKMLMRFSNTLIFDKDTYFYDHTTDNAGTIRLANGDTIKVASGDTLQVFTSDRDYARYDFSTIKSKPATLKLWLASKRGEE
ncbi:hypothetical protein [Fibrobacter sp. UWB11]|uniref:hypothetical protein n=1 Tax=Fibrobacter sp. UWB11 TaxID=1896202 RepID=UPI000928CAC1|nr:hypothetical protein [Fibrobacter sp. UWB11]SIN83839.1 hypothetical protein SAMN05720758_0169 [Fibrobacter sp. UWB11]